jgi:FHS family glucose/mannose:H+ symporter-like MFS transporter
LQQRVLATHIGSAHSPTAFRALAPVFFYFAVAGITTVMLGPLLPALIQHWQIQDAQAGTLFTASFAGQLCGACFAVRNLRASVLYGAVLTAVGCLAMVWATFNTAHIALFCVGLGLGAGLTAGNVIAGTVLPTSRARLLALLNVAWSGGAIACPAIVNACGPSGLRTFFSIASISLAIAAIFAIVIPHTRQPPNQIFPPESDFIPHLKPKKSRIPLPLPTLLMFSIALLLYVGVENTLGGWLPSFAIRVSPAANSSTIAMYFWMAELIGRLLMAIPTTLFGEATLYRVSAALLFLIEAFLLASSHLTSGNITALTILCGITLAPLYPLILSFLLARTGRHPGLGPLFATASLGGATLPWLTGVVSTRLHSLRTGFVVPAIAVLFLFLLSAKISAKPSSKLEA